MTLIPDCGKPAQISTCLKISEDMSLFMLLTITHAQNISTYVKFHEMSRIVTTPTELHVRPAKTQISLGIHPV